MAPPKAFKRDLRRYLADKTEEDLRRKTLMEYERVNLRLFRMLEEGDMEIHPLLIGRPEINYLRSRIPIAPDGNFRNQEYHLKTLLQFLKWAGNPDTKKLAPRYASGFRTKADWMDQERMEIIRIAVEHDPELSMLFHLEGDLALRRIDVLRLRVQSFDRELIHIRGKGRLGGKPRTLKAHPETSQYMADFQMFRERLVQEALLEDPTRDVPDALFLYYRKGWRLAPCQKTAMDQRLHCMRDLSGLCFGHHTLRRTCAREWWKEEVPLETISEMLGHKSIKTTREYLGITVEDMGEAHQGRYNRSRQIRERLRAKTLNRPNQASERYTG
jgi:integrase